MLRFLSGLILILCDAPALGQTEVPKTEILIIGTLHHGNRHFNHKELYKILRRYKPGVILSEQSSNFKPVFGLSTARFLRIWKPSIEQSALQKYSRGNNEVKILPYDTSFPSRPRYIEQHLRIDHAFFDRLNSVKMILSDSIRYADYANKRREYYQLIDDSDLSRINKPDVIDRTRVLYALEQGPILSLGKQYLADSGIVQQFEKDLEFWAARNNYMSQRILLYVKQFAGQRIIILTGLNHKYFLQDQLMMEAGRNISFIELEDD